MSLQTLTLTQPTFILEVTTIAYWDFDPFIVSPVSPLYTISGAMTTKTATVG